MSGLPVAEEDRAASEASEWENREEEQLPLLREEEESLGTED